MRGKKVGRRRWGGGGGGRGQRLKGTELKKESDGGERINDTHCSFFLLSVLSNANH